ncbi:hypothetical protein P7H06_15585 [Paenibacillus larvae]|nr:hypothetical protein [Paenibacillus larvae]MDT2260643.1 hypothetical protein [Paenibacillus larvae]
MLKANPFLADKPQQPIGGGTNPSGDSAQVDAKDMNVPTAQNGLRTRKY